VVSDNLSYRIGIDVGGTFTDFMVLRSDGRSTAHKTPSTPSDPSRAVLQGLREIAGEQEFAPQEFMRRVEWIIHGTTVSTNAVLTGNGARTGLLTTAGFRDVLEMRDGTREESYNNKLRPPTPIVPRHLRRPVRERTDYKGDEIQPVEMADVEEALELFRQEGVEAIAISFVHSPMNPDHEQRARQMATELMPEAYVSASSDLLQQIRFYDRTSTVCLNAYAGPIIARYLDSLQRRLRELDYQGVLLVMQSNGGVARPNEVVRVAANTLLSGPASGPTTGVFYTSPHGIPDCLTVDMGGTSFDVALVKDGTPLVVTDGYVGRGRLALPMIDIHTVGAGGGSIGWVDEGGLLHMGPASAGADPGPACYGRGGTEPTTTDADLLLGYLNPDYFLGGQITLNSDAAKRAVEEKVAEPLGLDAVRAAAGMYQLVNVNMASAIRETTVKRGYDPREFPLVVAGGAGPVHAGAIAQELNIPLLFIPADSSVFCADGMLMCDFKHDFVRTYQTKLSDLDPEHVCRLYADMGSAATHTLLEEGLTSDRIEVHHSADARYEGQWYEITVPVPNEWVEQGDFRAIASVFHRLHESLYGYRSEQPVELTSLRVSARGLIDKPALEPGAYEDASSESARKAVRPVWLDEAQSFEDVSVYDGHKLRHGALVPGPAVIERVNTTVVVHPNYDVVVDAFGNYVMFSKERADEYLERFSEFKALLSKDA